MASAVPGMLNGSLHLMPQPSCEAGVTLCHFTNKEMVAKELSKGPKLVRKVNLCPQIPRPSHVLCNSELLQIRHVGPISVVGIGVV